MKYYLIAGEASGDLHASNLMKSLTAEDPQASFRFYGGDRMREAGKNQASEGAFDGLVCHYRDLAYMGFWPVLTHAGTILRRLRECKKDIAAWHPDVLILVDYADFNLKIAKFVRKNLPDVPVHYYISPKIWAWKGWRIRNFKRDVDRMYIVFPFEKEYFRNHRYEVDYVGNPSVDSVSAFKEHWNGNPEAEASWLQAHGLQADKPVLALLPGSRRQEVRRNLSKMLVAAAEVENDFQVVVSGAPGLSPDFYREQFGELACPIVFGETYALLSVAHTALVVSGTATLETALFNVPQVVCYYMPTGRLLTRLGRRFLIRTPFISLVNLVAGYEVVRELVSYEYTLENLKSELSLIAKDTPQRAAVLEGYRKMREELGGPGASERAARLIVGRIGK